MLNYFKQYLKAVSLPLPEMSGYFRKENDYLKRLVDKSSLVLDVGCGNGRTMKFLAPHINNIIGIDYDLKMVREAKKNLKKFTNTQLIKANFFQYKFNKKFDLVLASYNLIGSSEMPSGLRIQLIKKMARLCKKGGHLVVSILSDEGIDFALKYYPYIGIKVFGIFGNIVETNYGRFKRFSKPELLALANKISKKFKITKLNSIFYLLDIRV